MCNEVSITCGNSGLKNAHLQLVHGSTLRLFFLLVPGGCLVTVCELLSIMRNWPLSTTSASPGTMDKAQDLAEWFKKAKLTVRGKLPFLKPGPRPGLAPHLSIRVRWAPEPGSVTICQDLSTHCGPCFFPTQNV